MVRHKIRHFLFMAVMLVIGIMPATVFAAEGDITYLNESGVTQTLPANSYTVVTDQSTWSNGWYVADGEVTIDSRVTVTGDVNLILKDGSHLTVTGGINVSGGNIFTVYAQSTEDGTMGELTATGTARAAGIGGGNGESGGTITINGGTVTANGSDDSIEAGAAVNGGAGIGGGDSGAGGTFTINGGAVTATGANNGAGIGGGDEGDGGTVIINGGIVTATGGDYGAGIGGGQGGDSNTIAIYGGTVTANGGLFGAGIGGGGEVPSANVGESSRPGGSGGVITIEGGIVTATGGDRSAGIGGGGGAGTDAGGAGGPGGEITIQGGTVTANGGVYGAGIGGGDEGSGGTITIEGGTITASGGEYGGAGIGGGDEGSGGTITIEGGTITASGGSYGAGIGGGNYASGGTITIEGGIITASGGEYGGDGIGDGKDGSGGTFTTGTNGTGIIFASSISDQTNESSWSGLIFDGTAGKLYSANYTLTESLTIPAGYTLTIESGATLTVDGEGALTNHGTITNNGEIKVNLGASYSGTQPSANLVQYQILSQADTGYTINYAGNSYVSHGTDITFTVSVQDGYDADTITVSANGQALTTANDVYTVHVTAPVKISVVAITDTTPPVISGITNGATYYTTQIATVSDESSVSITLNETAVSDTSVLLPGNTNATYVIVAEDAAGNSTTYTVTMKPIASLTESVDNITSENVTFEDEAALEEVKADLEAVDTEHATAEETAELDTRLEQINQALDSLKKAQAVQDAIAALPNTVEPDDTATETWIKNVRDQYDALTEHEKSLISDELKTKLENLLASLLDYRITEGNAGKWTVGDTSALTMTANGPVEKFTGIEVDGNAVDAVNYTVTSGSTIISLKPEYLNTLSVGKHTLTVIYTDGKVSGEFEIVGAQTTTPPATGGDSSTVTSTGTSVPQTGDNSNLAVWLVLMTAAACGIAGMTLCGRKKKYSK